MIFSLLNLLADPNWLSAIGTIGAVIISLILASLNSLKFFFKAKPHLVLKEIHYTELIGVARGTLELTVENKGNSMATNGGFEYVIINKANGERVADSTNRMNSIGVIGPKCQIKASFSCDRFDSSHDYEIWICFKCSERKQQPSKVLLNTKIESL